MKKEASKVEERKENISDVMSRYDASFSISLREGFAHITFKEQKMYVTWLNDEGCVSEWDDHETPMEDIERVADFMRDLKALQLDEYTKKA